MTAGTLADVFEAHLSASWLRPENVVWDTLASAAVAAHPFTRPTLDLGSGNGIFSFLTAGGRFDPDFDWFRQADGESAAADRDLYDAPPRVLAPPIVRAPAYRIDVALDQKRNLLEQAGRLDFYNQVVAHDARQGLPFPDGAFATVFSNILYWFEDPVAILTECARVLRAGGLAMVCVPDPAFVAACESYRWRELGSEWLRLLNLGRGDILWTATPPAFERWAAAAGFQVTARRSYLQPRAIALWDGGLRPVSRLLIQQVNDLSPEARLAFKHDWMAAVRPLLRALLEEELRIDGSGGFHLFVLRRIA